MITGKYKEDVANVAEKLMIAFSVEFVNSVPNTMPWEEAIKSSFELAEAIVNREYKYLNIKQ